MYSSINMELCECVWQGEAMMQGDNGGKAVMLFFCTYAAGQ